MQVGVLGSGEVGRALAAAFHTLGHEVMLGARSAANPVVGDWARAAGDRAAGGSFADAAGFGEVLAIATRGTVLPEVVEAAGIANFAGKLVLDVTNPLDFSQGYPNLAIKGDDSGGETLQRLLPEGRVVKTLNTVNNRKMFRPRWAGGTPDMLMAGDDAGAKSQAGDILAAFGWHPVDLGGIVCARWLEAMCMAWVNLAVPKRNFNVAFTVIQLE